jgi:hypothetical protein
MEGRHDLFITPALLAFEQDLGVLDFTRGGLTTVNPGFSAPALLVCQLDDMLFQRGLLVEVFCSPQGYLFLLSPFNSAWSQH